jgi:hypothetical protein
MLFLYGYLSRHCVQPFPKLFLSILVHAWQLPGINMLDSQIRHVLIVPRLHQLSLQDDFSLENLHTC